MKVYRCSFNQSSFESGPKKQIVPTSEVIINANYPLKGTIVELSSQRQDTGAICSPQGDLSSNFFFNAAFRSTSTVSPSGQVQDSKSFGLQAGLPSLKIQSIKKINYPRVNSSPLLHLHVRGFTPSLQGEFFSSRSFSFSLKPE